MPGPIRLLMLSELTANIGFFLVLPFLAGHITGDLALSAAVAAFVLGLRTACQQGLFFLGGTLTDKFGTRPLVLAGCSVRIAGFVLLAFSGSLTTLVCAAAMTGLGGALLSPAIESMLARETKYRADRTEYFALFAFTGEIGSVLGPLIGTTLFFADFTIACLVAAVLFALLLSVHALVLPNHRPARSPDRGIRNGVRTAFTDRTFLLFSVCYAGYLVSYNQLFLAMPTYLRQATGDDSKIGWLFAFSSVLIICGQLPLTRWCFRRFQAGWAIAIGLMLISAGFAAVPLIPGPLAAAGVFVTALTVGQMLLLPTAQTVIARLAPEHLLGTYFGLATSISGASVLLFSLTTGRLLNDLTVAHPWLVLAAIPLAGALGIAELTRRGRLSPPLKPPAPPQVTACRVPRRTPFRPRSTPRRWRRVSSGP